MVAGALAGFGFARQAVVMSGMLRIYTGLSLASLFVALILTTSPNRHGVTALQAPLYLYQRVIGHLDGRPCSAFPVCSLYARQALKVHGPLLGSWLMLDRLIHEADDVRIGPWTVAADGKRLYDPLSRNDFWLTNKE